MVIDQQEQIDTILVWNKSPKIGSENMASKSDLNQLQNVIIDLAHKSVRPNTLILGTLLESNMTPVIGAIMGSIGLTTAIDGINSSNFEDGRTEFDLAKVIGLGYDLDVNSETSITVEPVKPDETKENLFSNIKPFNY